MPSTADPLPPEDRLELADVVRRALAEDIGGGDVTAESVVPPFALAEAKLVQKESGVVFGIDAVREVFAQCGVDDLRVLATEGEWRDRAVGEAPLPVLEASGPARAILAAERVGLNLLGRLSGIATLTARHVRTVGPGGATILDTRKTTPGLRALEKAAVAAGGGSNHRFGLFDAILIKENHAALAGGVGPAVEAARAARPDLPVEVECRTLDEVAFAIGAGADRVLLDNMDLHGLAAAVALRDRLAGTTGSARPAVTLEASGGVNLENVAEISATGVDFISIGALTHSAPALDFSLLLDIVPPASA